VDYYIERWTWLLERCDRLQNGETDMMDMKRYSVDGQTYQTTVRLPASRLITD
jgi:hypothetical protein